MVPHLELVVSVSGSFVEWSVVTEPSNVINTVEALDTIGHAVHLQHADTIWYRCHSVDLEILVRQHQQSRRGFF